MLLKWLNILGMVLQFISFWCAAPELLGESAMKRLENGMTRFVARIPVIIVFGSMMTYALAAGLFGVYEGLSASRGEEPLVSTRYYFLFMGFIMAVYLVFMVFYKRVLAYLEQRLAQPLVHHLVVNADARRNALVLGAVLLTLGFLLQLVVALLT
ncbi:MAG: hypothetical protein JNM62_16180 [Flavobacteriales bacterium]|nr:hypothetical protein [Flavobacteriales bacterium]